MTPDPSAVPDGWQVVRLRDVARLTSGKAPTYTTGDIAEIPVIGANGRIGTTDRFNATLGVAVGRVGASGSVRRIDTPVWLSDNVLLVQPEVGLADNGFLHRALASAQLPNLASQTAQPLITQTALGGIRLRLPPLAEQRAIAAVLDSIDEAIERTEEVIAATERLRDALLHELLTRGLPGRHSEWADVPGLGTAPACWQVTTVGRCLERIEAGSSPRCESRPARGDEWGVLKVSSVSWGVFKPPENKALLEPSDIEPRYEVKDGDLIMSRANTPDLVGRAVLVRTPPPRLLLSDKTLRLVPDPARIDREFLLSSLRLPRSRSQIAGAATGSSRSMFNVSQDNIRKVRVALPPLDEQRAIDAALGGVDGAIERAREERAGLHSLQASAGDALLTGRVRVGTERTVQVG